MPSGHAPIITFVVINLSLNMRDARWSLDSLIIVMEGSTRTTLTNTRRYFYRHISRHKQRNVRARVSRSDPAKAASFLNPM